MQLREPNSSDVPIREAHIEVGEPLPWPVYDSQGNLLLREGFVIQTAHQRAALVARGVHRKAEHRPVREQVADPTADVFDESSDFTVFELVEILMERLASTLRAVDGGVPGSGQRLLRIADDVHGICERSPDALLGALQINQDGSYALLHPLHAAIICDVVTRRLALPWAAARSLVAGALSHDVGLLHIHDELQRLGAPLPEETWVQIRKHPGDGEAMLRRAGVDDERWLDAVRHHHERLDGSGYPDGLQGERLPSYARILAIADIYSAMVRPRPYRDAILAREALRGLFMSRGETIDADFAQAFIKEIGVFPPGAVVRLVNGEVGVVTARGEDASHPAVCSVISCAGQSFQQPQSRDTRAPAHQIRDMLPLRRYRSVLIHLQSLWPRLPPVSLT